MNKRMVSLILCCIGICFPVMAGGAKSTGSPASTGETKPVELDLFINFPWFATDSWIGIIPEEITRKTGVKLNVTRAVDDRQLGLMIASGNLPDLIFTDQELNRLADEKFAYSYNGLIKQYGLNWQPDKMVITNSQLYNKSGDGNYYFLLTAFSSAEKWKNAKGVGNMPSIGVRQDILDALGNPPLNTLADFERVLGMVKARYPNMIPYVAGWINTHENKALRVWSGVSNENFAEEDGKVIFYINSKNYRQYLQYVNGLYRKGYMIADNYSLTDTDVKAFFQNGQCFALGHVTTGEIYTYGEMAKSTDPKGLLLNKIDN